MVLSVGTALAFGILLMMTLNAYGREIVRGRRLALENDSLRRALSDVGLVVERYSRGDTVSLVVREAEGAGE